MSDIILTTLNAKYIHSSFGLRYLYANLGKIQDRAEIIEFNISHRPIDIVEKLLAKKPKIIGFGVYIWNCVETLQVIKLIKRVSPEIIIIIGGPEVSFESDTQEITEVADYCITGEADLKFREVCESVLNGNMPDQKIIFSPLPKCEELKLPYEFYDEKDIASRIIYVEASRGCPFTCEFCLSSLDVPVRQFELEPFLQEMQKLYDKGVRQFKFVDRTFNLNLKIGTSILNFFLERYVPGLFVHFEMIPDRLPEGLREVIKKFPKGSLQFEVGIQSFNLEVNKLISRKQNFDKIAENIRFLRSETGVHIHADLIAGLPGEDLESFSRGFNTLLEYDPQEIQVGILKRLRGTPIIRHDAEWEMKYSPDAPYEILSNKLVDFQTMQRISRFSRYWDLFANSGNFLNSLELIWHNSKDYFNEFMAFSDWIYEKTSQRHAIALDKQRTLLADYVLKIKGVSADEAQVKLKADELLHAKRKRQSEKVIQLPVLPIRQARHAN